MGCSNPKIEMQSQIQINHKAGSLGESRLRCSHGVKILIAHENNKLIRELRLSSQRSSSNPKIHTILLLIDSGSNYNLETNKIISLLQAPDCYSDEEIHKTFVQTSSRIHNQAENSTSPSSIEENVCCYKQQQQRPKAGC